MQTVGSEPPTIQAIAAGISMPLTELETAVERRLTIIHAAGRTRSEYREEAEAFRTWFEVVAGRPALGSDLTVGNADSYLVNAMTSASERGRPWAQDSVAHHVAQLRAFGGHAGVVCDLGRNPLASFSGPPRSKRANRIGDALEDGEIMAVLSVLDPGSGRDLVALGLIAIGYEDGPRSSEGGSARVQDFVIATAGGQVLGPVLEIGHPAKKGPVRTLPLGRRAEDALRLLVGRRTEGALFPSRTGEFLSPDGVRDLVSRAGKRARVELTPQRLRRTAASWQATYGAASGHLDTVFGWVPDPADVKSGHYVKPTRTQLLYAHQTRLSPLDRLELRVGRLPFV